MIKDFTKTIQEELRSSANVKLNTAQINAKEISDSVNLLVQSVKKGGKILIIGNGGSAADAQHIAADFVGKFRYEVSIPAISLTTDTSILTALSNDYHFNFVFSKQVASLGTHKDVLIAISTSGISKNVLEAIKKAREKSIKVIALTSMKDKNMHKVADVTIKVPSTDVARIQEAHICIGHIFCHLAKKQLNND